MLQLPHTRPLVLLLWKKCDQCVENERVITEVHWRSHKNIKTRDRLIARIKWAWKTTTDLPHLEGHKATALSSFSPAVWGRLQEWFTFCQIDPPAQVCAVVVKNPLQVISGHCLPESCECKMSSPPCCCMFFGRWTAVRIPTLQMRKAKRYWSAPRPSAPSVVPMESPTAMSACSVPTTRTYCTGVLRQKCSGLLAASFFNSVLSYVTCVNSFKMSLGIIVRCSVAWTLL